jgi:hypothetical protein
MQNENFSTTDKMSLEVNKGAQENFNPRFNMKLDLFDHSGNLKETREIHNTMTTAGKNGIMDQLADVPTLVKAGWMEVGTGSGGTTSLNAYIAGSRTAVSTRTRTNNAVAYVCSFAAGAGTGAITEAGLFDAVTQNGGNMWCYATFSVINKGALDTLQITWTITGN